METQQMNEKMKTVYTIVERGRDAKSIWVKVGVGFVNRDGSINLRLDAIPVNGTLQVRDYEPFDPRKWESSQASRAASRERAPEPSSDSLI
jgi:hypothetical protein